MNNVLTSKTLYRVVGDAVSKGVDICIVASDMCEAQRLAKTKVPLLYVTRIEVIEHIVWAA
jgi:hypothetical protein